MIFFSLMMSLIGSASAGEVFKGDVVKPKIQKPEIQILITKRNLTPRYELELKESFLPQIVDAAEKKPF
jgi:hypothetical protein